MYMHENGMGAYTDRIVQVFLWFWDITVQPIHAENKTENFLDIKATSGTSVLIKQDRKKLLMCWFGPQVYLEILMENPSIVHFICSLVFQALDWGHRMSLRSLACKRKTCRIFHLFSVGSFCQNQTLFCYLLLLWLHYDFQDSMYLG